MTTTIANTTGIIYTDCKGQAYTYNDILVIAKGNPALAEKLYKYCMKGDGKETIQNKFFHMEYEGIIDVDGNFLPNHEIADIAQEIGRLVVEYLSIEQINEAIRLNHTAEYDNGKLDAADEYVSMCDVCAEAFASITGVDYDASDNEHVEIASAAHKLVLQNDYYFIVTNENVIKVAACFIGLLPEIKTSDELTDLNVTDGEKVDTLLQTAITKTIGVNYDGSNAQHCELTECAYIEAHRQLDELNNTTLTN